MIRLLRLVGAFYAGGICVAICQGAICAEINDRIVHYSSPSGSLVPNRPAEMIVYGLPVSDDHPMHPFSIDAGGKMYIDPGTASNS
ncbi:MAG: hypothetical protein WBP97_20505 [Candidatus Sulfotelmatobacter sp.]